MVPIAGTYQQIGARTGIDDFALDPASTYNETGGTPETALCGLE
jgi:hypothetical protein